MKTYSAKAGDIERKWYVIDATDQTLGRLATRIAVILRGKHKPIFTPHLDCGDYVVVVNASKIRVTGNRLDDKMYYRHSGYPGRLKSETLRHLMGRKPELVIEKAVRLMLPKTKLSDEVIRKLKVYGGPDHPHGAQQPEPLEL